MIDQLSARPIRKAHEQVYDQLLESMLTGAVPNGQRLPSEPELAATFGVSRSTIRLALGLLQAEGLILTSRGAQGGSVVTLPTIAHVSDFLERNLALLSLKNDVTLEDFLEARSLLEVFAVRQVASRRDPVALDRLRENLRAGEHASTPQDKYIHNREFHVALVDLCNNSLLRIAALPIFTVLHTNLGRSALTPEFSLQVCAEHAPILGAIEAGDANEAEKLLVAHLAWLGDVYRTIWEPPGATPVAPTVRRTRTA
jgi:GntR family transcriptional repressor for pyruvate dehydrogenase complex